MSYRGVLEKVAPEWTSAQHRHIFCVELRFTTHVYNSPVDWHCCCGGVSCAWRSCWRTRRRRIQFYIKMLKSTCNIDMSFMTKFTLTQMVNMVQVVPPPHQQKGGSQSAAGDHCSIQYLGHMPSGSGGPGDASPTPGMRVLKLMTYKCC